MNGNSNAHGLAQLGMSLMAAGGPHGTPQGVGQSLLQHAGLMAALMHHHQAATQHPLMATPAEMMHPSLAPTIGAGAINPYAQNGAAALGMGFQNMGLRL